jgi:deoxyribodipyrimidine photolyase-related protein
MLQDERFLHHSLLSAYINAGLLHPLAVCRRAEDAWRAGLVPLAAPRGSSVRSSAGANMCAVSIG